jgi:RNA polymerase sigma factor (sigma-70 family)
MATNAMKRVIGNLRRAALAHAGGCFSDGNLLDSYIARRDESAFEALVCRHGPMVFGVCRRILGNEADAEDAFQATFLVLVRKARSIQPRENVGSWLHGVAHNTALNAKSMIRKRRSKEREAGMKPMPAGAEEVWGQVQDLVDGELARLPEKYRLPIVVCDLEGKTIKVAASQLGWPQGTVATQLRRGRAELAKRLSKHGLTLSGTALAAVLSEQVASAGLPLSLVNSTVKAAGLFAAGNAVSSGVVSTTVVALTEGVLRTMLLKKLKTAVAVLLVVALGFLGAGALLQTVPAAQQDVPQQQQEQAGKEAKGKEGKPGNGPKRVTFTIRDAYLENVDDAHRLVTVKYLPPPSSGGGFLLFVDDIKTAPKIQGGPGTTYVVTNTLSNLSVLEDAKITDENGKKIKLKTLIAELKERQAKKLKFGVPVTLELAAGERGIVVTGIAKDPPPKNDAQHAWARHTDRSRCQDTDHHPQTQQRGRSQDLQARRRREDQRKGLDAGEDCRNQNW